MKPLKIFIISLSIFMAFAMAQANEVQFPINELQDVHVSSNQKLQIITSVLYPNGCYRPENVVGAVDSKNHRINLTHLAELQEGMCSQAFSIRYVNVSLDKPNDGIYTLWDSTANTELGTVALNGNEVELKK